ncbi:MAG: thioredoxin [Prevotellaceae bacterium]|jgi:thioredoxin 1|nr:thioredoxin [Prevotellaceae bacterium]
MALEINKSNHDEIINSGKPVVIDFWAEWCGPCRNIAPYIEELAEIYGDKAIVGKINVEESNELAVLYGVRHIPTVIYIKNGKLMDKQIGVANKDVFAAKLEAIL